MPQELWKALAYLYPNADPLRDYRLEAVGTGEPFIAAWHLPQPQPTAAEIAAAIQAYDDRAAQQAADASALRQRIVSAAQSAVGVPFDQLTAVQVRALLALLLHAAGGLDREAKVRPLDDWAR